MSFWNRGTKAPKELVATILSYIRPPSSIQGRLITAVCGSNELQHTHRMSHTFRGTVGVRGFLATRQCSHVGHRRITPPGPIRGG